jgi:hypothetical protein
LIAAGLCTRYEGACSSPAPGYLRRCCAIRRLGRTANVAVHVEHPSQHRL